MFYGDYNRVYIVKHRYLIFVICHLAWNVVITGKSLSEALIFASTNPQYDDRLFIELQVQYIKFQAQT